MENAAWTPQQGTQLEAIQASWCEELFFGGARGGGKSDFLLGDFARDVNYGRPWKGIIFRKTYDELEELIYRSYEIFPLMGAQYAKKSKTWFFPRGSTLKFRSLEREEDANKYQGHSYTWIGWDELPNWATDGAYSKLKACLRSADNIPDKRIRSTGNPGGAGHHWVKQYFIDPEPLGYRPIVTEDAIKMFIPSKVGDNKILLDSDPKYISRLKQVGSKELVRAWLEGDWNVVLGAFFDNFSLPRHVVNPFTPPKAWTRIRAFDWGSYHPFAVLWGAVSDGQAVYIDGQERIFPRGAIVIYREWYGCKKGKSNVGVKMKNSDIAEGIIEREKNEVVQDLVADPAIFSKQGAKSIAEQMEDADCYFWRANNERIIGWQQVRQRLGNIDSDNFENDVPLLYICSNCTHLIRTLPLLEHDDRHFEDIDTESEDHLGDTLRYLCMTRPITRVRKYEQPMHDGSREIQEHIAKVRKPSRTINYE